MVDQPRVSIVLPTYNGQKYLLESIGSCLLQSYDNLELIIVDDASTDATDDIIAAVDDPRIVFVKHETNRKQPSALNTGFAISRGEYLTWTSDDNQYALHAIQTMVDFLNENPDVDFVYTGFWIMDGARVIKQRVIPAPPEILFERDIIGACFMYRREVYEQIGDYNPNEFVVQDYEYWLRVAKRFRMAPIEEPLYFYRIHRGSQTNNYGNYNLEIAGANLLEEPQRSRRLSHLYERMAYYAFCQGQKGQSFKYLFLSVRYQPSRVLNGDIIAALLSKIPKVFRHL